MCIVIIKMTRLKQIALFLIIVVTIYSTMLFYLLMSVQADPRLQEIDYLEKTRPDNNHKVLFVDRLVPISERLHHFSISRVSHKEPTRSGCSLQNYRQGVLLVGASGLDLIGLYSKALRQLQTGLDGSCIPEVFVLQRLHPLFLNTEQNINQYVYEIGEVLKYFTIEAQFQLSIFSHEEGALLTLVYFVRKNMNRLYYNVVEKIKTILFVDITHPFLRIQYDPPYKFLQFLKVQIMSSQERVRIFNRLRFVIITTHKEDSLSEHFFFRVGRKKYSFAKTLLISSREMANVHYYLPPNSLSFPPLVRRLTHFLAKDFGTNLTLEEAGAFLRHGQSYSFEKKRERDFKGCAGVSMAKSSEMKMAGLCVKLTPFSLEDEEALIMYSPNHFQVYSNNYNRVYPFDNLTEGSVYIFQRMSYPLYILNPASSNIYIRKDRIASPMSPLNLNDEEVMYTSQMLFTNYSIVRICPNVLLTFPLHFAQGNIHRKFLGEGQDKCFIESSLFQNFSWQLFQNWALFRNMIIFTLVCSLLRKQSVSQRVIEQFSINMIILMCRDYIESKLTICVYIISFSILVEYANNVILHLVSYFTIKQKWASFVLLGISGLCIAASFFDLFNYWKIFGVAIVFFVNKTNLPVFLIKLYFLKEDFPYNALGYDGITELILMTLWLYTSLISLEHKLVPLEDTFWTAQYIFTAMLLITLAAGMDWPGGSIENMVTVYMKLLIVLRMLRIFRK